MRSANGAVASGPASLRRAATTRRCRATTGIRARGSSASTASGSTRPSCSPTTGRPLSHPDLDRAWSAFVERGVTPVFHVADQPRPFDDAWYTDREERGVPVLESVFLYMAAALSCTDLIVNGVLARHPDLHIGIV